MNQNRRGQRRQQRSRNRPPPNRSAPQQDRHNQTTELSQCNLSDTSQSLGPQTVSSIDPIPSNPGLSQQQQNPYTRTYTTNPQGHVSSSSSIVENNLSQQLHQQEQSSSSYPQQDSALSLDQQTQVLSEADRQADALYSDMHGSLVRAIDSSYAMPISEHFFYSSYESYDNIMVEQRRQLDEMMAHLSRCSQAPIMPQYYVHGAPLVADDQNNYRSINFSAMEDMHDRYDSVHEFSEQMYDRIGHDLDDASGLRMRDAQLIQATLQAANQNKLNATTSQLPPPSTHPTHDQQQRHYHQHQHLVQQANLSSSSSSSSLTTRPSETNSPSLFISNQQQQVGELDYQSQQTSRNQQSRSTKHNDARYARGQQLPINVIPSVMQNQYQQRNQYGGYMGKQQYGSPYYQRFSARENKNIPRPQDSFMDEIDNTYKPFEPLIKEKPNALVPLSLNLEQDDQGNEYYTHPYEYEIRQFEVSPDTLSPREPVPPVDFNSTPVVLVETVEQLEDMCRTIEKEKEIAVDVEHHSYRSYQGITCLLQISTRTEDFVIDTIKLRSELQRLNKSFTDPRIVKVFHGADCDILWLQRDFGVYVVNLFDTSRAAKLMRFAHLSLAFLMKHYCNVELDKSYQLADWRERPLPMPMIQYARTDTHFLLYIYDRLRNDLLQRVESNEQVGINLLRSVFDRCREICLKRYEKPPYSDKSHLSVLRRSKTTFNAKQMYAFKEMYQWRDKISRKLDESVGYVLPNNLMIRIAQYLPREPQGITAICNPVPPTLKKYLNDVHAIILKALEIPLDEASKVMNVGNPLSVDPSLRSIDLDSINHKQDVAHAAGLQDCEVHSILGKFYDLNCDDTSGNGLRRGHENQSRSYRVQANDRQQQHQRVDHCRGQTDYIDNLEQNSSRLYNFLANSSAPRDNRKHQSELGNVHQSIQRQFVSPYSRYESRNN